jgi:hypothetical protein
VRDWWLPAVAWLLARLDRDRHSPRKTNRSCTCWCEIYDPATDERATVVDGHDNGAAIMFVRHAYLGPERQRPMRGGECAGVQSRTTGGLAAALDRIHRRYSRLGTEDTGQSAMMPTATAAVGKAWRIFFLPVEYRVATPPSVRMSVAREPEKKP